MKSYRSYEHQEIELLLSKALQAKTLESTRILVAQALGHFQAPIEEREYPLDADMMAG